MFLNKDQLFEKLCLSQHLEMDYDNNLHQQSTDSQFVQLIILCVNFHTFTQTVDVAIVDLFKNYTDGIESYGEKHVYTILIKQVKELEVRQIHSVSF